MQIVPMQFLAPGETGCISDIDGERNLVRRLGELGLKAGSAVRMIQPGQPCIVAVENQRLSFRGADDALVLVEVERN